MTKMMKILKILAISVLLMAGFGFAQNSGIPTNKVNNVVIKKILEKNYTVEIDEDGAKGAAITTISLEGTAMQEYKHVHVDVNRPFVVTINNPHKHEVLFIGLINDPSAK